MKKPVERMRFREKEEGNTICSSNHVISEQVNGNGIRHYDPEERTYIDLYILKSFL